MELSSMHPKNHTCLVSIGSGQRRPFSRFRWGPLKKYAYIQAAVKLITDTETVHENMLDLAARSEKFSYFRFDVPGLEDIALDEWMNKRRKSESKSKKMHTVDLIEQRTHEYLAKATTRESVRRCAEMIVESYHFIREPTDPFGQVQVPARDNSFCGRQESMHRIYGYLESEAVETESRLRSCVLYGLGGIGKTQIVIEYIYRYRYKYVYVFWIRASDKLHLAESYSSIARNSARTSTSNDQHHDIQLARHWLSITGKTHIFLPVTKFHEG